MNSYFEQTGFYGSHHQAAGTASGHHHEQTAAAAAAYRFPLGLSMPYTSSQHHHHHSLHQSRPPQDSPYDASVAAACKLYSSSNDTGQQSGINYSTSIKSDCSKSDSDRSHQNGYAAVVAAAAKDVWQSATTGGSATVGPVRPAACTPDTRYSSVGLVGGDPASSPGAAGGGRTSSTSSWNTCSLGSSASQPTVGAQLHQQPSNHTFYPWMAIAGNDNVKYFLNTIY